MAYVTTEIIQQARAGMKALNKEYGVKSSLSGKGASSLCLTIAEGSIDFIESYCNVIAKIDSLMNPEESIEYAKDKKYLQLNQYYLEMSYDGIALEYLEKAKDVLMLNHWDKSDTQTDYFHCSFYIDMRIGQWNKPYKLTC